MVVSKRNWFVRFTYLFGGVPERSSLCALFWRGVVFMPLLLMVLGGIVAIVLVEFYMYPFDLLKDVAFVVMVGGGILGALIGLVYICLVADGAEPLPQFLENSVAFQSVKSVKSRFCPIVRFAATDDTE